MTVWPEQPVIYEINTAVWLDERSRAAGRRVTLADVAAADWDAVISAGVDAVWLMGVWERSPAGLALTAGNAELQASFRDALPACALRRDRVAVLRAPLRRRRGLRGPAALAAARAALAHEAHH